MCNPSFPHSSFLHRFHSLSYLVKGQTTEISTTMRNFLHSLGYKERALKGVVSQGESDDVSYVVKDNGDGFNHLYCVGPASTILASCSKMVSLNGQITPFKQNLKQEIITQIGKEFN